MAEEQSSIQRFLQHRAPQILISPSQRAGTMTQIAIGGLCMAIALGLVLGGLLSSHHGLMFGAIGPAIAGTINLIVGITLRRRIKEQPIEVKLTPEAKAFLLTLVRQANPGWHHHHHHHMNNWMWTGFDTPSPGERGHTPVHSFLQQIGKQWGFVPKTARDVLPKPVYDLLDTACYHYNRVTGLLEAGKSDAGISKISAGAKAGADEAIFAILHHAATMNRYPETVAASSRDCEEKIRALKELADGLERIQTRPVSISDRLGYTSAMDTALEEIRLERLAREELTHVDDDQSHLRDRL